MPILFSARTLEISDKIPINEKSSTPSIRKVLQPSARSVVLSGTSDVRHTSEISFVSFTDEKELTVQINVGDRDYLANGQFLVKCLKFHFRILRQVDLKTIRLSNRL